MNKKKYVEKKGIAKGQISSTKNKFEFKAKTKIEEDEWEIVEKAGKLAGLTNESDEDSE